MNRNLDDDQVILWEGRLTLDQSSKRDFSDLDIRPSKLPVVSVGRYTKFLHVTDLVEKDKLPNDVKTQLKKNDIYYLRAACSFRPKDGEYEIEMAQYLLDFECEDNEKLVILDIFPREDILTVKKNVKLGLTPSLSFGELDVNFGGASLDFMYDEIQPKVYGNGIGEDKADWTYYKREGYPIYGSKVMHVLFEIPQKVKTLKCKVSLSAKINIGSRLERIILGRPPESAKALLKMELLP